MRVIVRSALSRFALVLFLSLQVGLAGCSREQTGDTESSAGSSSHRPVDVALHVGGEIRVAGESVPSGDFMSAVKRAADPGGDPAVIRLTAEDRCLMKNVSLLQDELVSHGFVRVAFSDASGEELAIVLPAADGDLPPVPEDHLARLRVTSSGDVRVNGTAIESGAVERTVAERLGEDAYLVVAIESEPDAAYGDFFRVFGAAKRAGARRIQLNLAT